MTDKAVSESPFAAREIVRKERQQELVAAGMGRDAAYVAALEEAWRTEVLENERLWDQAEEILALRAALRPFAQHPVAAQAHGSNGHIIGVYAPLGSLRRARQAFEKVFGPEPGAP